MMDTEKQIEFDKIKELWMSFAVTGEARERIEKTTFCLSEWELRKQLKDTTDGRNLMERLGTPPLQRVDEVKELLMIAKKGGCLTPYQLERVEKALVMVRRLKDYMKKGKEFDNPLAFYEENLDELKEIKEEISRQIRGDQVDDYASGTLQQLRNQMIRCEEQMKQKAEQIMRSYRECMADSYCTLRNGRICVPVKKECKQKVAGSVIGKSATGNTLFVEPAGVAKLYEELELLKISEENEVYRILYTLSSMVGDGADRMRENMQLVEKLDFILSKGKLSMELEAREPSINTEQRIFLQDARHPLMDRRVNVPLQFEAEGERNHYNRPEYRRENGGH